MYRESRKIGKRQKEKGQAQEEEKQEGERKRERFSPRSDLQTRVYHRRRIYFGGCNHLPLHRCRSSLITSYNPSAVGRGRRREGGEKARAPTSIRVAEVGVIANVITHVAQTVLLPPFAHRARSHRTDPSRRASLRRRDPFLRMIR